MLRSELLASLPRHTAPSRTRTRLIMFNYISLKFKNPLKERIALAAGRCLPTHRGNHRLLCLNYMMLPWAVAREPGYQEGTGAGAAPKHLCSVRQRTGRRGPRSVLASGLGPAGPQRCRTTGAKPGDPAKTCPLQWEQSRQGEEERG